MTSNYRQQIYDVPFSGLVPPPGVGSSLDDDFSASRPGFELDGSPYPGYVALAEKWQTFDPDQQGMFAAIDPRLQMALISGSPGKGWMGVYQSLPVPSVVGETKQLAIYARASLAFVEGADVHDSLLYGLMLGSDFAGAPSTSSVIAAHAIWTKEIDDVPTSSGDIAASVFASFDSFGLVGGLWASAWPAATYFRIRLLQRMDGVGDFAFQYGVDAGIGGQDWLPLVESAEVTAQPAPQKSIGIGIRGDGTGFGAYFDAFRVLEQSIGDLTQTIGGTQQLGAV